MYFAEKDLDTTGLAGYVVALLLCLLQNQGALLKQYLLPFKQDHRRVRTVGKAPSGAT